MREVLVACWWQCCAPKAVANMYIVGGYYTNVRGEVTCWMGEEIIANSDREAYLIGLENGVQFLLEEMNMQNENIILVSNRKDLVDWIKGKEEANWGIAFLRNKTRNRAHVFYGLQVIFKHNVIEMDGYGSLVSLMAMLKGPL
ncbi:hypothetical protein PIB30_027874 [Stylosanthes scabra]|uniref:RNase H type-1 domain-containing protein n=1 Tax=Stylosanthes scabra TaxID=79078 RepID=A0ABU6W965_9FABA|nr:hypothetical protein [Stylosanthes scabra]